MIYLILTSTSRDSLLLYTKFLNFLFENVKIKSVNSGLLIKKKRLAVLKSPHVYKKSKEHFEVNKFRTCFCLKNVNVSYLFLFRYILQNKPKSVTLKIKKF